METLVLFQKINQLKLKQSTDSCLIKQLRKEFERAKESYEFGPANTVSQDWSHIVPLSYLASLNLHFHQLITIVTDSRNIVLSDSTTNRENGASIDLTLITENNYTKFLEFINELIYNKESIIQSSPRKKSYSMLMSLIECYLSKTVSTYNKINFPKLKDYIIWHTSTRQSKIAIDDFTFRMLMPWIENTPSLAYYLQIFNLSDKQINKLFEANAYYMLLKYYNLSPDYELKFKDALTKYITLPNLLVYYIWITDNFSFEKADNEIKSIFNSLNKEDTIKGINNYIELITTAKKDRHTDKDIDQDKYLTILTDWINLIKE